MTGLPEHAARSERVCLGRGSLPCEEPGCPVHDPWGRKSSAAPAPDTDALAEMVARWEYIADSRASVSLEDAGAWAFRCAAAEARSILTPAQPAEPTQSDAGEVGGDE